MTEEILDAAIMRLRAVALEKYALLKDIYGREIDNKTVDKLCEASLELAKYQTAMNTLQNYKAVLTSTVGPVEGPAPPASIVEENLKNASPTFRQSQKSRQREGEEEIKI